MRAMDRARQTFNALLTAMITTDWTSGSELTLDCTGCSFRISDHLSLNQYPLSLEISLSLHPGCKHVSPHVEGKTREQLLNASKGKIVQVTQDL